jgi:Tfp pilus assembly protein PilF
MLDAALRNELGDVLLQLFRPADAEVELRAALSVRRERLGPSHPDTADTANKLGAALFYQQKGGTELPQLWSDALVALEACGTERPALSSVLNNLGAWAHAVDRDMERAEQYLRRGLEVGERVHGSEHPLLATSLANVATFDQKRGDLALAQQRLARALAILERKHGTDHAHVRQIKGTLQGVEAALAAAAADEREADPAR